MGCYDDNHNNDRGSFFASVEHLGPSCTVHLQLMSFMCVLPVSFVNRQSEVKTVFPESEVNHSVGKYYVERESIPGNEES